MTKRIVVIGGGPAALEAARTAAHHGADVALVADAPLGGRAGWHSLLPSKVWLHAAETQHAAHALGLLDTPRIREANVLARIRAIAEAWNGERAALLTSLGVETYDGVATFIAPDEISVRTSDGEETARLGADAFIIATGSVPIFPPDMRPDGKRILAPRFASHLDRLPRSMIVIGGGATGSEFAFLFDALGVETTWVVDEQGVLPMFAPDAGAALAHILETRGVRLIAGQRAVRAENLGDHVAVSLADGRRLEADMAFIAIGRRPDTARLGLEAAGVALREDGAPVVDAHLRTNVPHIFAVGDVIGRPMIANRAMAQAYHAALNAVGRTTPPFRDDLVVFAIYTEPQVAQVGVVEGEGLARVRLPLTTLLKAAVLAGEEATHGFFEMTYHADSRRIAGAVAVVPHAADALTPVMQAIAEGRTVDELAAQFPAHPTISEFAFEAARHV
nr:NAD(P)/FAD-dependent oxidoreductase [Ardenticatena sp.]